MDPPVKPEDDKYKAFGDDTAEQCRFTGKKHQMVSPPKSVADRNDNSKISPQASVVTASAGTITDIESAWPRVIEYVKTKRMSTGIFLSESSPVEVHDGTVVLGLPQEFQFHKEMLEKNGNRQLVEEAFEVVARQKVRVQFVVTKPDAGSTSRPAAAEEKSPLPEIIVEAMNIFEGSRIIKKD